MGICCIPYCRSTSGVTKNVSFFEFPSNISLRELWLKNIKRANWLPKDRDRVCSLHFKDGDIRQGLKIRRLVNYAVPTVFPTCPEYICSESKIIRESQPKREPSSTGHLVHRKEKKIIEIKENDEDDSNSNITTQEDTHSLLTSFNISSPNLTQSFCANCVNCNANLRYRNRFDFTNRLAFPNWKFNLPRTNEVPLMKISVSDAIRFIYELTVDDLIRVGLTADNSKYPSFDDVFVCKQCGDIISELYCAHKKLKYISDADAVLRKAIKCKIFQPDVKNENSYGLQMEGLNFSEENVEIDSEMRSQEDQDPLADNLQEKHHNTVELPAVIDSSVVSLNVAEINTLPAVKLERLKTMQFPAGNLRASAISINSKDLPVERGKGQLATSGIQIEQAEEYVTQEVEELENMKIGSFNKEEPEILTDLPLEFAKQENTIEQNIEMNSIQCLIEKNKAKKFTCDCGHKSSTRGLLRRHIGDVHNFRLNFRCGICAKRFTAQRYLRRHQKTHSEKNHMCVVCGKYFALYAYLTAHHKKRHPTHVLPERPKRVSTTKSPNVKLERKSKQSSRVKDSTKKKLTEKQKSIVQINKSTKKSSDQGHRSHLCITCGRTLSSKDALEDHMRLHTGEKPFKCNEPDCEMTFRTSLNLKVHKANVHTNEFPFPCKIEGCDRKFKLYRSLRSHCYSQHPRLDKLFICEICGKPFKFKSDLEIHLRTHEDLFPSSEIRKFKCEHCKLRFADKSHLNLHVKVIHTKEISFICEDCGKSCSSSRSLRNHKRVHSGEKPYKCEQCNKQWASHAGLWWHQQHSHKT